MVVLMSSSRKNDVVNYGGKYYSDDDQTFGLNTHELQKLVKRPKDRGQPGRREDCNYYAANFSCFGSFEARYWHFSAVEDRRSLVSS